MCNENGCFEKISSTLLPWAYFTNGPDAAAFSAPFLIGTNCG